MAVAMKIKSMDGDEGREDASKKSASAPGMHLVFRWIECLTWFIGGPSKDQREQYKRFRSQDNGFAYFLISLLLQSTNAMTRRFAALQATPSVLSCINLFCTAVFCVLLGWFWVYLRLKLQRSANPADTEFAAKWSGQVQSMHALATFLCLSLDNIQMYSYCSIDEAEQHGLNVVDSRCDRGTIFYGNPFAPVVLMVVSRSVTWSAILFGWIFMTGVNTSLVVVHNMVGSLPMFLPGVIFTFVTIMEYRRQHLALFSFAMENEKLIKELKERVDETALEMRHMIGNVAHDLKTPLAGLSSCAENITTVAEEAASSLEAAIAASAAANDEDYASAADDDDDDEDDDGSGGSSKVSSIPESILSMIRKLIEDLRSIQSDSSTVSIINTFMLMTINRCIDYTKASNGLKLTPRPETVDMTEVLNMPLRCMKGVQGPQSTTTIVMQPIPESICTHIITDKQWLVENVLCLLSNAVKYSAEGIVTMTVSLLNLQDALEREDPRLLGLRGGDGSAANKKSTREGESTKADDAAKRLQLLPLTCSQPPEKEDRASGDCDDRGGECSDDNAIVAEVVPANTSIPNMLVVEIEDMGIGLNEETMINLFRPFRQAMRMAGGTGLGLFSLALRIDALGGIYGVSGRSDGAQGTRFWFSVPYRPDEQSDGIDDASDEETVEVFDLEDSEDTDLDFDLAAEDHGDETLRREGCLSKTTETPTLSARVRERASLRILLVEDTAMMQKMITRTLERNGHHVTLAPNGAIALKLWCRTQTSRTAQTCAPTVESKDRPMHVFDLVVTDLQMPVMDGFEFVRRLRQEEDQHKSALSRGPAQAQSIIGEKRDGANVQQGDSIATQSKSLETPYRHQIVIAMSANSDRETMTEAMTAGADAFMEKPFTIETFTAEYSRCTGL